MASSLNLTAASSFPASKFKPGEVRSLATTSPIMTQETRQYLNRVADIAAENVAAGMTATEAVAAAVATLAEEWPAITAEI